MKIYFFDSIPWLKSHRLPLVHIHLCGRCLFALAKDILSDFIYQKKKKSQRVLKKFSLFPSLNL